MLPIFSNPQFRLLWLSFSLTGVSDIMFMLTQGWLTLEATGSPFWVGTVAGMSGIGAVSASIPGGVLIDRISRKKIVIVLGLVASAGAGLMAVPVLAGNERLWQVLLLSTIVGVVGGIRSPAFLALTLDIAGRRDLLKANAANFGGIAVAGVTAPLMAGWMINAWGIGWVYVLIAATGLIGVGFMARLAVAPVPERPEEALPKKDSPWRSIKQGTRYVLTEPRVRALISIGLVAEAFAWAHNSMLPVVADDVLNAGAIGLGYLQSGGFVGFLVVSLILGSVGGPRRPGVLLVAGCAGFCVFLILFALSRNLYLSLLMIAVAYGLGVAFDSALITIIQLIVPDNMRGRVISFQTMTWGINGVSGFHMGALSSAFGAPVAIIFGACVTLAYVLRLAPMAFRLNEPDDGAEKGEQEAVEPI